MIKTTTAPPTTTTPAFPAKDIEACIRDSLALDRDTQNALRGGGSVGAIGPQPVIDSLVVVGVLCGLELIVPFELPDSLVRAGGYDSIEETIRHLMPQLEERWQKYHQENK